MPPHGFDGLMWQDDAYAHSFDSRCSLGPSLR